MNIEVEEYFNLAFSKLYNCPINEVNYYKSILNDRNYTYGYDDAITQTNEQIKEAIELLTEGINKFKYLDFAYKYRGDAYFELKFYDLALKDYNQSIQLNPIYEKAFISRGILFSEISDLSSSLKEFNKALSLNNKNSETFHEKANAVAAKLINLSFIFYNESIKLNPNNIRAYNNRGKLFYENGFFEEANLDFKTVLKLCDYKINDGTADHRIYYFKGWSNIRLENYSEAINDFNIAIDKVGFRYQYYVECIEYSSIKDEEMNKLKNESEENPIESHKENDAMINFQIKSKVNTNSNEIQLLFFDTETTGVPKDYKAPASDLNNWPRLVQLGYLIYNANGKLINSGNHIIKPVNFTIPIESSAIHGITTQKAINEGVDLMNVLLEIKNHIEKADYLVAHNMAFDEKILGAEFLRNNMLNIIESKNKICTMESSIEFCAIRNTYGYKWPKLLELHIKLFGCDFDGAHNAFSDINATAKCFWELKNKGIIKIDNLLTIKNKETIIIENNLSEINNLISEIPSHLKVYENKLKYPFFRLPLSLNEDGTIKQYFPYKNINQIIKNSGMGETSRNGQKPFRSIEKISNYFGFILNNHFCGKVYKDVGLQYGKKKSIFLASDFLIYDKETNLHIAIQIDSPYDIETRYIKNYYESDFSNEGNEDWYTLDNIYSDYFDDPDDLGPGNDFNYYPSLRINPLNVFSSWFFVKFSEKQIIQQPNECCKFIIEKIYAITNLKLSEQNYSNFQNLIEENMWTFDDATKMEAIDYRKNFTLKFEYVNHDIKNYNDYKNDYIEWYNKNMPQEYDELPF